MKLKQKTLPSAEPFDLDEAKAHLRINLDDDDDLIEGMITAARVRAEQYMQKSLVTQQWYLYLDYAKGQWRNPLLHDRAPEKNEIKLPMGPIQSLDAFEYMSDATPTWAAVDTTLYYFDAPGEQIILLPNVGLLPEPAQWKSGFRVTFTAGFGDMPEITDAQNPNKVPATILIGIKTILYHFYENRTAYMAGKLDEVPAAGEALLMPHRAMDY